MKMEEKNNWAAFRIYFILKTIFKSVFCWMAQTQLQSYYEFDDFRIMTVKNRFWEWSYELWEVVWKTQKLRTLICNLFHPIMGSEKRKFKKICLVLRKGMSEPFWMVHKVYFKGIRSEREGCLLLIILY